MDRFVDGCSALLPLGFLFHLPDLAIHGTYEYMGNDALWFLFGKNHQMVIWIA